MGEWGLYAAGVVSYFLPSFPPAHTLPLLLYRGGEGKEDALPGSQYLSKACWWRHSHRLNARVACKYAWYITPLIINDCNTTPISTDLKKYLFTPPHNIDVDFERV